MGGRGQNTSDGRESAASEDWFAQQLGAGWRTSGDGIYEYVGEPAAPSEGERSLEQDLVDEIAPIRQTEDERKESEPPRLQADPASIRARRRGGPGRERL